MGKLGVFRKLQAERARHIVRIVDGGNDAAAGNGRKGHIAVDVAAAVGFARRIRNDRAKVCRFRAVGVVIDIGVEIEQFLDAVAAEVKIQRRPVRAANGSAVHIHRQAARAVAVIRGSTGGTQLHEHVDIRAVDSNLLTELRNRRICINIA